MTPRIGALREGLEAARRLAARIEANPLEYFRWLVPQAAWLMLRSKRKLLRAGNQAIGKSTAGIAELIWRCLGCHPFRPDLTKKAIRALVICTNAKQSLEIQQKIYALIPKGVLDPKTIFDSKNGFGANNPVILFKNGSRVRIATDDQGPRAIQGGTQDYIWIDELCSPEMYREAERRVLTTGGDISFTLTPINAPGAWLKELCEKGAVDEIHAALTVENLRYAGSAEQRRMGDGAVCDQAWIDAQWRTMNPAWGDVVLNGAWNARPQGSWFGPVWDPDAHISDGIDVELDDGERATSPARWHLGIDYASADRPDGLVAVLTYVQPYATEAGIQQEFIVVVDEVLLPGTATMTMFAQGILRMLARNNRKWGQLRGVYGDNPVQSRFEYKSNLDLTRKLCKELRIAQTGLSPRIMNAKEMQRSGGSLRAGASYLYEAVASKRIVIHPRCKGMIEAFETWILGDATHKAKDRMDALRYSLKDYIFGTGTGGTGGPTVRFRS